MPLVLLLGGARCGKSSVAVRLARASGLPVTFVATGEARDAEMGARIARHRAERPVEWTTIEEPLALEEVLRAAPPADAVVVDCLSLWVSNLFERGLDDGGIEGAATRAADAAAGRRGPTIAVTNEVGLGIVPPTPVGRRYRDVLGRVNALWAAVAHEASLVVAGRAMRLERFDV